MKNYKSMYTTGANLVGRRLIVFVVVSFGLNLGSSISVHWRKQQEQRQKKLPAVVVVVVAVAIVENQREGAMLLLLS